MYINPLELIQAGIQQTIPDPETVLKSVDEERVYADLRRKKISPPSAFIATEEPKPEENFARLPTSVQDELTDIHHKMQKTPDAFIKRIEEFKSRYPNVPYIYNLLANTYKLAGNPSKYLDTIQEEHRRFPEYLFGKTHLAEYYLEREKPESAAEALEHKFDINEHFPSAKGKFHISEIISFYSTVGFYFAAIDKPDRALACYFIVNGCKPDHPLAKRPGMIIVAQQMRELMGKVRGARGARGKGKR